MSNISKYDNDFHAWAMEQAALLRANRLSEADIANIAEEIESMGRSEKRELVNRLAVLLAHLLKWRFQPGFRGASWRLSVLEQRDRLREHLKDNPSLNAVLPEAFETAYRYARRTAQQETGFGDGAFPTALPWSREQVMDDDFWPASE